jgi:hypothetical protein
VKPFPGEGATSVLPAEQRPDGLALGLRKGAVMRFESTFALVLLVGCDQGPPPFDELPLRDALHATPEVVASLPDSARVQLAARFDSARAKDDTTDELVTSEGATPAAMVASLDRVRQGRKGEPLVAGVLNSGAAWPIRELAYLPHAPVLPPIEGTLAATTATMETRSLQGEAGAAVRALFAASGAHHLYRVVGWPVGAVAIDDTVYVNASWLVSLAPPGVDGGTVGGSADPGAMVAGGAAKNPASGTSLDGIGTAPATHEPTSVQRGALTPGDQGDAGVVQQPSSTNPPSPPAGDSLDACSGCAAACDSGDGDSCDGSDDSCANGSDDGSDDGSDGSDACASSADASDGGESDACANAGADGSDSCSGAGDSADAASCQISRGGGRKSSGTRIWLLAPLAFLLLKRRP